MRKLKSNRDEQIKYLARLSQKNLQDWIERALKHISAPLIFGPVEPHIALVDLYKESNIAFQQRFRKSINSLLISYAPSDKSYSNLEYLGKLIYLIGRFRFTEQYHILVNLLKENEFVDQYATDEDRFLGNDMHLRILRAIEPYEGVMDNLADIFFSGLKQNNPVVRNNPYHFAVCYRGLYEMDRLSNDEIVHYFDRLLHWCAHGYFRLANELYFLFRATRRYELILKHIESNLSGYLRNRQMHILLYNAFCYLKIPIDTIPDPWSEPDDFASVCCNNLNIENLAKQIEAIFINVFQEKLNITDFTPYVNAKSQKIIGPITFGDLVKLSASIACYYQHILLHSTDFLVSLCATLELEDSGASLLIDINALSEYEKKMFIYEKVENIVVVRVTQAVNNISAICMPTEQSNV
ncbi:MAG TPA: hypothetical protein VF810_04745 [Patescibacteria group bacterium]